MRSSDQAPLEQAMRCVPAQARWAFADEMLWEGILRGEPVRRGPQGLALFRFMGAAASVGLGVVAVLVVGCREAVLLLRRQRQAEKHPVVADRPAICVFVGFGAQNEEGLATEYLAMARAEVLRVDQTNMSAWRIGRARPGDVWRALAGAIRDVSKAVAALPEPVLGRRSDFLTTAARRIGHYAFARAMWQDVQRRYTVREACFLTANVSAFAAVAEGVHSVYLQHGLVSRGVWYPEFSEVHPLTRCETTFLGHRIPRAIVHGLRRPLAGPSRIRTPRLIVASSELAPDHMLLIVPLLRRLTGFGLITHVRLFRGEPMSRFWGSTNLGVPFEVATSERSFDDLLDDLRPSFVVSWGSTTLVDALYRGVIPITVARSADPYIVETIYPLFRCCLRWPTDDDAIHRASLSREAYDATLTHLQQQERASDIERIA